MKNIRIVIITGLSGSGKSTALRALEDIGFFCVDNLPIILLPKFLEIQNMATSEISKVALVMDVREPYFLEKHADVIAEIKKEGYNVEVLFLDATNEVLVHRFSETRRAHPLSKKRSIIESILFEREKLISLKEVADNVIDTSLLNLHQLKNLVQHQFLAPLKTKKLIVNLISFGYRYGLPNDADIVLDVRFLPNPYFVEALKDYTGNDGVVVDYVMSFDESKQFLLELYKLVEFMTPLYEKEGKAYLNIAIGCTGGKHRSVTIVNQLAQFFTSRDYAVNVNHRDIQR